MNSENERQDPVYSKISHTRSSNVHDYVDIDGNSTLESNKTEYCKMEPQIPHVFPYPAPPLPLPLPRPSGSFSRPQKQADRSVKRSVSIGPVNDIYSYKKKRQNSGNFFSFENYVNNRILAEDFVEENMYGSWCSSSHKALLGSKCGGSCLQRSDSSGSKDGCSVERGDDPNYFQKFSFKVRSYLAVGMFMLALVAVFILAIKVIEKYEGKSDMNVDDIQAILDFVSSSGDVEHSLDDSEAKMYKASQDDEGEFFGSSSGHKPKTRKDKGKCCKNIKITSTGIVSEMYPYLLGVYENKEQPNTSPVYKMENENRFLSRPYGFTKSGTHTYSWGINSKPNGKWGWIKAFSEGPCPDIIRQWKVYNQKSNKWIIDKTLNITCTMKL